MRRFALILVFMMLITSVGVFAEDAFMLLATAVSNARINGIFEPYQTINAYFDGNGSVQWKISDTKDGTYTDISGATLKDYTITPANAVKWIKFVVTGGGTTESDPRYIAENLVTRGDIDSQEPALSVVNENTPTKNVFTVSGKEFILLDTIESEQSKFYIMTKAYYGNHLFLPTDKGNQFMSSEPNGVRMWLNGEFLTNGNSGSKLPQDVIDEINMNHVWTTEPRDPWWGTSVVQVTTNGVGLLSLTELYKYCEKIGLKDGLSSTGNYGWWTRTPQGKNPTNRGVLMVKPNDLGKTLTMNEDSGNAIRPTFYVGRDFFKNIDLDKMSLGENVIAAIRNVYTAEECEDILGKFATEVTSVSLKGLYEPGQMIEAAVESDGELGIQYEWQVSDTVGGTYANISGATVKSYTITSAMAGKYIRVGAGVTGNSKRYSAPRKIADILTRQSESTVTGARSTAPDEYVFAVDGKEFVLLDVTESDESKYFVYAKDLYGTRPWNTVGGQIYDSTDVNSIAYWVNNDLQDETHGFPQALKPAINSSHKWRIEPRVWGDGNETSTYAGVSLLSVYELQKYADRIGTTDGNSSLNATAFWLRTPVGTEGANGEIDLCVAMSSPYGRILNAAVTDLNAVRPCFYLGKDAFKKFKMQKAGEKISELIRNTYSGEELLGLYTVQELKDMFGYVLTYKITGMTLEKDGQVLSDIDNEESFTANVGISSIGVSHDAIALVMVYDAGGRLVGADMQSGVIPESGGLTISVHLSGIPSGTGKSVKTILIDDLANMNLLTKTD